MTITIKEYSIKTMQDEVVRTFGFEAKKTITFFTLCEKSNNYELIRKKFQKMMKKA